MYCSVITHYDRLIEEGNDPVYDPEPLKAYMDQWDGNVFLEALALEPSSRVLEIGVGTGRLALRTIPLCGSFTGIDLSPKTIGRARENLRLLPHCNLVCSDFMTHDFGTKFDVVYSSLTFMHFREKAAAIRKICNLLAPGGRMVISIDKNSSDVIDMGSRQVQIYPDDPGELREMAKACGLKPGNALETEFAHIIIAVREQT